MNLKLSRHVESNFPPGITDVPQNTIDMNIGYGSGMNSNPSTNTEFRDFFADRILSKIRLENKRRKMKDALDFLKPSSGLNDWSGDSYSRPLDFSGKEIR